VSTVAENGEIRRLLHFSATVWTGFNCKERRQLCCRTWSVCL